jgi:hypothetical protein
MNEFLKCGIYTQWNFIQPLRRMKFCHYQVKEWCKNCKKVVIKDQALDDTISVKYPEECY